MNYITTTDLRTKSSALIISLERGDSISLVHRSKIIGIIKPAKKEPKPLTKEDIKKLQKIAQDLRLPEISYEEREKRYREHLMEKYGKNLS